MSILLNKTLRFWLVQLGLAFILIVGLIILLLNGLKVWTRHDEFITVPDLSRKTLSKVQEIIAESNLRYEVLDSATFNPKYPRYSVISQNPEAGQQVKKNRKIYLTINPSDYQKVSIPRIIQITRRSAEATLKAVGLSVGKITYVDNIGKDMVLKLFHKGKEIFPGDQLTKTSVIDLECGNGLDPNSPQILDSLAPITPPELDF